MQHAISQVDGLPSPPQHPLGTRYAKTMAHQTQTCSCSPWPSPLDTERLFLLSLAFSTGHRLQAF